MSKRLRNLFKTVVRKSTVSGSGLRFGYWDLAPSTRLCTPQTLKAQLFANHHTRQSKEKSHLSNQPTVFCLCLPHVYTLQQFQLIAPWLWASSLPINHKNAPSVCAGFPWCMSVPWKQQLVMVRLRGKIGKNVGLFSVRVREEGVSRAF